MSFMSNTGVFLIVTTIISIAFARVKNASFTCCYSNECPLSVFKQWSGEPLDVLSFSNYIIYETSCCPDNCKVYGVTPHGVLDCMTPNMVSIAPNSLPVPFKPLVFVIVLKPVTHAITDDDTCDGSQYMTDTSCPDASVDDVDLIPNTMITTTQGPQDNHIDYKCTYDPG
eukprot:451525_1